MVLSKHNIEAALYTENQDIAAGRLREDSPLDVSEGFRTLCQACRRGDLKVCQEKITEGVNINARDSFDYTPLILASLCGHYEVVQLLLESGALCERDTFQGERCLYNALNDRIRNLLLSYEYSKSTNPLQPFAGHLTSLLTRETPKTSDLTLVSANESFRLHKFVLASRSPYFRRKLLAAPETTSFRLPNGVPSESLQTAIRFLYLSEVSIDFDGPDEEEILKGIDRLSRQLEIERLFENVIDSGNRRVTRQRRTDELNRGQEELESWFRENLLQHKITIPTNKVDSVRWDRNNGIYADVLLCADFEEEEKFDEKETEDHQNGLLSSIPIGPAANKSRSPSRTRWSQQSVLFPAHRAMLTRSEYFMTMFSSGFREAHQTEYLQIIRVDCSPEVLEVILTFLYTEKADFGLDIAIDILFAADQLFIEKLKVKAGSIISSLGNGATSIVESDNSRGEVSVEEVIDIYDVIRAGWLTRVQKLEEFGARYLAYRLEHYIDQEDFIELVKESAGRIKERQETDTIELIDDIRFYLDQRFRMRFEDVGLEEMEEGVPDLDMLTTADVSNRAVETKDEQNSDVNIAGFDAEELFHGVLRTLDGEEIEDEFDQDAQNYRYLLGKIDTLLERLKLDA